MQFQSQGHRSLGFHEFNKLTKQVVAVVWAGGGFGVVLHGKGGEFTVADPFDGLVIEVQVSDLYSIRHGFGGECEAMVL